MQSSHPAAVRQFEPEKVFPAYTGESICSQAFHMAAIKSPAFSRRIIPGTYNRNACNDRDQQARFIDITKPVIGLFTDYPVHTNPFTDPARFQVSTCTDGEGVPQTLALGPFLPCISPTLPVDLVDGLVADVKR